MYVEVLTGEFGDARESAGGDHAGPLAENQAEKALWPA